MYAKWYILRCVFVEGFWWIAVRIVTGSSSCICMRLVSRATDDFRWGNLIQNDDDWCVLFCELLVRGTPGSFEASISFFWVALMQWYCLLFCLFVIQRYVCEGFCWELKEFKLLVKAALTFGTLLCDWESLFEINPRTGVYYWNMVVRIAIWWPLYWRIRRRIVFIRVT